MAKALALAAVALAAGLVLGALPAAAHTVGSPPIPASGSIVLQPDNHSTSENQLHVFVEQGLNLPVSPGDTLTYNWSANGGLGPAIEFTIHNHLNGTTNFVESRADNGTGALLVTDNRTLMVSFVNPTAYPVNVTYEFVLYAPTPTFSPAFFIIPAAGGVAVGWFLWVRAGRPADEGGLDEAFPGDPAARHKPPSEEE